MSGGSLAIRPARKGEAPLVLQFIRELAEYEKLTGECVATEAMIDAALFARTPRVFCDIAEWEGETVGFAFWFLNFSTFSGKSGLYLEDLFGFRYEDFALEGYEAYPSIKAPIAV